MSAFQGLLKKANAAKDDLIKTVTTSNNPV